ncbi:MAG TPA: carbamoyltransferase C-terminal domain-containing protein [Candidatus Saccharimonadales bacterium]|nr:carbamoyltransferase C-terminal domain-containing protein [Candidatus Saccharimonadales bacterium]
MITLGFNYSQMHDSSACIARDGELLFAVAEERISRIKHDAGFPLLAIRACLDFAKVDSGQLDFICQGWPAPRKVYATDLKCFLRGQHPATYLNVLNSTRHFASMAHQNGGFNLFTQHFGPTKAQMRFVDHHLAHAISAYSYGGFDKAAVVVMDGRGAWEASSIWYGHDGRLDHVLTIPWPNSLGLFYAQFTQYLGFVPNSDEWKVMGLAPYGSPGVNLSEFISLNGETYRVNAPLLFERNNGTSAIAKRLGPERTPESEIDDSFKNVAFAVQDACENAMQALVKLAIEKTGCRNLCLAGGVALNSKANGKIQASGIVDNIFVQPAASDDGVALGAVYAPYLDGGGRLPMKPMRHAYLGPEFSDAEIEKALVTYKLRAMKLEDVAATTAELLANGKIIGWFQGRMEFGPRALGHRSILADPRDPEMNAKVNNAVKFREWWRPFAPSMLKEAAGEYLEYACDSPFMILTNPVRPEKRDIIPSVTHVDGSARPQTVEKDINPLYWNLINEFGKRTSVPVIMNTSFNLRGEAIVNTPTDAIRTFFSSGMDALVIGSYLVEK